MTEIVTVSDKLQIQQKLYRTLQSDEEMCEKVLQFLEDPELRKLTDSCWLMLKNALTCDNSFRQCCEAITEEIEEITENRNIAHFLERMNNSFLEANEECSNNGQGLQLRGKDSLTALSSFSFSLVKTELTNSVVYFFSSILKKIGVREMVSMADEAAGVVSKAARGSVAVTVVFGALYVTYKIVTNVKRWWKGEITLRRLAKNLLDEMVSTIGGTLTGMAIGWFCGNFFTPVVALIGGAIGSVFGTLAFGKGSERFTQWLFGIPCDEDLENAYVFFGLNCNATDNEVNTAYRRKCLKYHPDKPEGDIEIFYKCQVHFRIIKQSREKNKNNTDQSNQTLRIEN